MQYFTLSLPILDDLKALEDPNKSTQLPNFAKDVLQVSLPSLH